LEPETAVWWRSVNETWDLEDHHRRLLTLAARSWDRAEGARRAIDAAGLTYDDKYGQIKPNPAVAIEATARNAFLRCLRELDLDAEPPTPSQKRGPALKKWRS
jgi:phage terminase small subunit